MYLLKRVVLFGALLWAVNKLVCTQRGRTQRKRIDHKLDDALKDTYPASDPTATQDFAIPANRQ